MAGDDQADPAPVAPAAAGEGVDSSQSTPVPEGEGKGVAPEAAAAQSPDAGSAATEAAAAVTATAAAAPSTGLIPELKAPTSNLPEAKGNGSLGYAFSFDLPAYRGTEPAIGLEYVSSRKSKTGGNYQGWTGYAWGLTGFDVVERARPRLGVPAYAESDIFVLNGVELVPCVVGMVSPSCATGGTHATENESYLRISFVSASNSWEITDRSGKRSSWRLSAQSRAPDR